jgi:hypothetical protein
MVARGIGGSDIKVGQAAWLTGTLSRERSGAKCFRAFRSERLGHLE